ncbi:MAG: sugar phosphate nucleotidyltransferase [Lachnospiraceae bacterium]
MRAVGIILAGGNNHRMKELSNKRAIAAMPIAGSYRSIDFALSNMTNSGVQKVAVLTQYNARSLNEHLAPPNGGTSAVSRAVCLYSHRLSPKKTASGIRVPLMRSTRTWIS